jgi:hypothetical protein
MKTFRNLLGGGNVPENHISSRQEVHWSTAKGEGYILGAIWVRPASMVIWHGNFIDFALFCFSPHAQIRRSGGIYLNCRIQQNRTPNSTIYNCKPQAQSSSRHPAPINPGPYNIQQEHINNIMNPYSILAGLNQWRVKEPLGQYVLPGPHGKTFT